MVIRQAWRQVSILLMLLLTACGLTTPSVDPSIVQTAQSLEQNPIPTPIFVLGTYAQAANDIQPKSECLDIDDQALWEKGNYASEISKQIESTLQVMVDNQPNKDITFTDDLAEHHVYENGTHLGSYGGPTSVCFNIESLRTGLHLAALRLTTISGKEQTYSWAFRKG